MGDPFLKSGLVICNLKRYNSIGGIQEQSQGFQLARKSIHSSYFNYNIVVLPVIDHVDLQIPLLVIIHHDFSYDPCFKT